MKQLTRDQAIELANSKVYENWTNEEIVRFQLFQEKLCMDFSRFHEALEKVLGRPVFSHEFSKNYDGIVSEFLGEKDSPTFEEIIELIPKDKRVVIGVI
jgi:hypothetical protein